MAKTQSDPFAPPRESNGRPGAGEHYEVPGPPAGRGGMLMPAEQTQLQLQFQMLQKQVQMQMRQMEQHFALGVLDRVVPHGTQLVGQLMEHFDEDTESITYRDNITIFFQE